MPSKQVKSAAKPPAAGKGRVKGTPNKTTALLKDAIIKAAETVGEDMGRLNTAQNAKDFREALQELRDIIAASIDRARRNAGQAAPAGNQTKSGVTCSIEE
ncbi:hypothetical protein L2W42_21240 (plasmid) [Rhizobium gallicum]|nr:hypothetical protein [Rhizobium gallicum]ULJ74557.1 hypothetical protein L2W42_21240 [Rhizobium gallicum]